MISWILPVLYRTHSDDDGLLLPLSGHSYLVYGPLLNGATGIVFEGVPFYPDAGRFWEICAKYGVSKFYTAPTAIRALMKFGDDWVKKHDLSALKVLGSVGEPINPEAWLWYHRVVGGGKCSIVDTFWQTETGGHVLTPLPGSSLWLKDCHYLRCLISLLSFALI